MTPWLRVSIAATRRWTALYTRGLDPEQRVARAAEIDSDLWEHQQLALAEGQDPNDTGFEILRRFLLGIPADLSWRYSFASADRAPRGQRSGGTSMLNRLFAAIATVLTLFAGAALMFIGLARGVDAGFEGIALWPAAAGLSMIAGAIAAHTSARIGTTLVAFGALTIVAAMPWMIAITLPLALIAIFGTLARGKGAPIRPA